MEVETIVKKWLCFAELVERFGREAAERLASEAPRRVVHDRTQFLVIVDRERTSRAQPDEQATRQSEQ